MNDITRPLTGDKMLGFDKFGQLQVCWMEGDALYSTIISDVRGKTCPICGRGWELSAPAFRDQHFNRVVEQFTHRRCEQGAVAMTEASMWYRLLCEPEHHPAWSWVPIPNEYRAAWNNTWYRVSFKGYVPSLKLGTRKNVYHLSLHDLTDAQMEQASLFAEEKATHWAEDHVIGIHAWTEAEARRHIAKFYAILKMDQPIPDSHGAQIMEFKLKEGAVAG